jgi:enamine deaminase RidA (YjgF/YER057c/UK114 family)
VLKPDGIEDSTQDPFRYSQAVVADDVVYVSGQIGTDGDGNVVSPEFEAQARQAFDNLGKILDQVNKNYEDITYIGSYIVGLNEHQPTFREVWADYYPEEPYPAHTMRGIERLTIDHGEGGPEDEVLVELEAIIHL